MANDLGLVSEEIVGSRFATQCAACIMQMVKSENKHVRIDHSKWVRDIDNFLRKRHVDRKEFKQVLFWYTKNSDNPAIKSKAYSGGGFCRRYSQYKRLMQSDTTQRTPAPEHLTRDAERACARLFSQTWPCTRSELQDAVQRSVGNYRAFRRGLRKAHEILRIKFERCKEKQLTYMVPRDYQVARHLDGILTPCAVDFVVGWMLDHADFMRKRQISPAKFVFDIDSEKFNRRGYLLVGAYCGNPDYWTTVLEMVRRYMSSDDAA